MFKNIQGYTYKVNQNIGKGYSSVVHKGIKDQTGQNVCIKVIEMSKLEDPINQMLLQYQVSALRGLKHSKHNLHMYDVYATKNNTYIITQLCQGDLGAMLKHRKYLPYLQAVEILKQLIIGYIDIVQIGYLHRDIKPANIFYKNHLFKIGDFGFAVPIGQVSKHKDYNVGSPVYMPPEALKDNIYTVSCDLWALGIIFYQMIKGVVPWRAACQKNLHHKLLNQPLESLTVGLPEIARKFLAKTLSIDPFQRLSPEQLLKWVDRLCQQQIKQILYLGNPKLVEDSKNNKKQNSFGRTTFGPSNTNNYYSSKQNQNPARYKFINQTHKQSYLIDNDFSQCIFFSNSLLCYIKFIHRCAKFINQPAKVPLSELFFMIVSHLFQQLQQAQNLILNTLNNIQNWNVFLISPKGLLFKKKLLKLKSKYKIFYQKPQKYIKISNQKIKQVIKQLYIYLSYQQNYDQKTIISMDYLTTLYQLLQLKKIYQLKDFLKSSKIQMIIEGNPYSVSQQHLTNLNKKIQLLRLNE